MRWSHSLACYTLANIAQLTGLTDHRWDLNPAHLCSSRKGWLLKVGRLSPAWLMSSNKPIVDLSIDEESVQHEGILPALLEIWVHSDSGPTLKELVDWLFHNNRNYYSFWPVQGNSGRKVIQSCIHLVIWTFFFSWEFKLIKHSWWRGKKRSCKNQTLQSSMVKHAYASTADW